MKCPVSPELTLAKSVCTVLRAQGKECYMVGGSVRDIVLGKQVHDLDLTTDATPQETSTIFNEAGYKVIPTGIQHGTVTVLFEKEPIEITTYRTETTYSDHRHPDSVEFAKTLDDDLQRRDFTINAMALDPLDPDKIVDKFGGLEDIDRKIIRAVNDPAERFTEDPLRMFRACRFKSKLEFDIDPVTEQAISEHKDLTKFLSPERIRDELLKTLETRIPSIGIDCFVKNGLLDHIIPELIEMVDFPQRSDVHEFDAYEHTLKTVDNIPPEKPLVRLAGLFHDIGKPDSAEITEKGLQFIHHETGSEKIFNAIADRLRLSNNETKRVQTLIANHMRFYKPKWKDKTIRKLINDLAKPFEGRTDIIGEDLLDDLLVLQDADVRAGVKLPNPIPTFRKRLEGMRKEQIPTSFGLKDLVITGHDVMAELGIPPSPTVGKVLGCVLDQVLENPSLNTRDQLIEILRNIDIKDQR